MKCSIATGILVQTLPVTSSEHSWSNPLSHDDTNNNADGTKSRIQTAKHAPSQILLHNRHSFGKQLMNPPRYASIATKNGCDPLSPEGDIGILACSLGYKCVASETSLSGGVCMSMTSRVLQGNGNDACRLCTVGRAVGQQFYNLVVDDVESGVGGKTCEYVVNAAYNNRTIDAATCPVVAEAVQAIGCCTSQCDLCGVGFQASSSAADILVESIPVSGYSGATCASLYTAAYEYATIDSANCPSIRQAAVEAGCCSQLVCYVCGPTSGIVEEYSAGTTCADLKTAAYLDNSILEDDCPAAVQRANDEGCCTPPPTNTGDCNICGDAPFYPDSWVFKEGPCDYVQSLMDDTACATYSPSFAHFCCGPKPKDTEAPVLTPEESTKVPIGEDDDGGSSSSSPSTDKATGQPDIPSATSPPSASMTAWSTTGLVRGSTTMGLAVMTVGTFVGIYI